MELSSNKTIELTGIHQNRRVYLCLQGEKVVSKHIMVIVIIKKNNFDELTHHMLAEKIAQLTSFRKSLMVFHSEA